MNRFLHDMCALRKYAAGPAAAAGAALGLGGIINQITGWGAKAIGEGWNSAKAGLPLTGLGLAYLLYKLTSPYAQAKNAEDLTLTSMERETLAKSLRDRMSEKSRAALESSRHNDRFHDKYI